MYLCSDHYPILMTSPRIQQLIEFLNDNPNDPFLLYALATEYLKAGQTADALRYYERLRTDHPDYVGTYYHLGRLYESLGERDSAIATYRQGMEVAQQKRDRHALSELQAVYQSALGLDEDDED